MKKQIREFPLSLNISPKEDYYVFQRVLDENSPTSGTTYKISLYSLLTEISQIFFTFDLKAPLILSSRINTINGYKHRAPERRNVLASFANWEEHNSLELIGAEFDLISTKSTYSAMNFLHGPHKNTINGISDIGFYSSITSYGEGYPIVNQTFSSQRPYVFTIKTGIKEDNGLDIQANQTDFGLDYTVFTKPVVIGTYRSSDGFKHRIPTPANVMLSIANWQESTTTSLGGEGIAIDIISNTNSFSKINLLHGTKVSDTAGSLGTNWTELVSCSDNYPITNRTDFPFNVSNISYKPSTFSILNFSSKGQNFIDITPYFTLYNKPVIIESEVKSSSYNHVVNGYSHYYFSLSSWISYNFNNQFSVSNWIPNACNDVNISSNKNAWSRINFLHGPSGGTELDTGFYSSLISYANGEIDPNSSCSSSLITSTSALNSNASDNELDNYYIGQQNIINTIGTPGKGMGNISSGIASTTNAPNYSILTKLYTNKRYTFTILVDDPINRINNITDFKTSYSLFNKPIIISKGDSLTYSHRILNYSNGNAYQVKSSNKVLLSLSNWANTPAESGAALDIQSCRGAESRINLSHGLTASINSIELSSFYSSIISLGSNVQNNNYITESSLYIDNISYPNKQEIRTAAGNVLILQVANQKVFNSTEIRLEFTRHNNPIVVESFIKNPKSIHRVFGYNRYFNNACNWFGNRSVVLSLANHYPTACCEQDIISSRYSWSRINFFHDLIENGNTSGPCVSTTDVNISSKFYTSLTSYGQDGVVKPESSEETSSVRKNLYQLERQKVATSIIQNVVNDSALDGFLVQLVSEMNHSDIGLVQSLTTTSTTSGNSEGERVVSNPTTVPIFINDKNAFKISVGNNYPVSTSWNTTRFSLNNTIFGKPVVIDGPMHSATRTVVYNHRVIDTPVYSTFVPKQSTTVMLSIANWKDDVFGCAVDILSNRNAVSRVNFLHGPTATDSEKENVGYYSSIVSYGQNLPINKVVAVPDTIDVLFSSDVLNKKTAAQSLSFISRNKNCYNYTDVKPWFTLFNKPVIIESFTKNNTGSHRVPGYTIYYKNNSRLNTWDSMLSIANWLDNTNCELDIISNKNAKSCVNFFHTLNAPSSASVSNKIEPVDTSNFYSRLISYGPNGISKDCNILVAPSIATGDNLLDAATFCDMYDTLFTSLAEGNVFGDINNSDNATTEAAIAIASNNTIPILPTLYIGHTNCFQILVRSTFNVISDYNQIMLTLNYTQYNKPVIIESLIKSSVYSHRISNAPNYYINNRFNTENNALTNSTVLLSIAQWDSSKNCTIDVISSRQACSVIHFLHGPRVKPSSEVDLSFNARIFTIGPNYTDKLKDIKEPAASCCNCCGTVDEIRNSFVIQIHDQSKTEINSTLFKLDYTSFNKIRLRNCVSGGPLAADQNGDVVLISSDARLKHEIRELSYGLNALLCLSPVQFKWKQNNVFHYDIDKDDYGLIAQEVQKIIPNIVNTMPSGYLSLDYQKLIPIIIKAIQELTTKVNELVVETKI